MALNRRSLLKKGALAGVLTAGAAALGIANAPAAQAGTYYLTILQSYRGTYGPAVFNWYEARPICWGSGGDGDFGPEFWRKDRCYKEAGFYKYGIYTNFPYPYKSKNYNNIGLDSVKILQNMLNRCVEMGYLGGSYITADGVIGNQTHYKVGDYQIAAGLGVDGVVGRATWNSLTARVGFYY